MNHQNLYQTLSDSYNEKNLNDITSHIIDLYRNKRFEILLQLGKKIKGFIATDGLHISRLFNRLITLYHPDTTFRNSKNINIDRTIRISTGSHIFYLSGKHWQSNRPTGIPMSLIFMICTVRRYATASMQRSLML